MTAAAAPAAPKENLESLLKVEADLDRSWPGPGGFGRWRGSSPLLKRIAGIRKQFVTNLGFCCRRYG